MNKEITSFDSLEIGMIYSIEIDYGLDKTYLLQQPIKIENCFYLGMSKMFNQTSHKFLYKNKIIEMFDPKDYKNSKCKLEKLYQ